MKKKEYSMINYEQDNDVVKISYYNEHGHISIKTISIPPSARFNFDLERGKIATQFKLFDGREVRAYQSKWFNPYRMLLFLHGLPQSVKDKIYAYNQPKKWFMDIETQILPGRRMPDMNDPQEKILTNAYCNQDYEVWLTGTKRLTSVQQEHLERLINEYIAKLGVKYKVKYLYYESEKLMLRELFTQQIPRMSWIGGWNFLKFDWNYLYNRGKSLGVKVEAASPTGKFFPLYIRDKYNKKSKGEKPKGTIVQIPMHRPIVDYMDVYEKYDTSVEVKESVGLDYAARDVFSIGKVDYPGSLMELYEKDYIKYLFYNAVDTILVCELDRKLQTFNTVLRLACEGRVPLHEASFASDIVKTQFSERFFARKRVFAKDPEQKKKGETYSGGYVKQPQAGMHFGLMALDFESLFPSIMMAFNQGVDTYLGKTKDGGKTYIEQIDTGEKDHEGKPIYEQKVHEIIPGKHIWSASGAVFDATFDSVTRETIIDLFKERLRNKHLANEIEEDIEALKKLKKQMYGEAA